MDAQGYVLISAGSAIKKYVEVEPGLLQNLENPSSQLALQMDENGQAYLITTGPQALIKAYWSQTQAFHLSVLGISLLVSLATLISWTVSFIVRLIKKRQPQPLLPCLGRVSGVSFILLLIAFLVGFASVLSNVDPVRSRQ